MKTKLFLIGLISIVLCFALAGCGEQEKVEENINAQIDKIMEDILAEIDEENVIEESDIAPETIVEPEDTELTTEPEEDSEESTIKALGLYSNDTQIVFKEDDTYMVFTHNGDEITGYYAYVICENAELAQAAIDEFNQDRDDDVKDVYLDGNKVVIEYEESVYEGLTVETVKLAYSFLQEVTPEQ